MKINNDLTTRQIKLYKYLKKQKDFKKIKDIMEETDLYGEYTDSINCAGVRALKKDINKLRATSIEAIRTIISNDKGYKIPTKKEYKSTSDRRWWAINEMIKLQIKQDRKAGLDGQIRVTFGQEKDVIEAFREGVANG